MNKLTLKYLVNQNSNAIMKFLLELLGIIGIIAAASIVYGLIFGCIRYWTRNPYDNDISFIEFFIGGIIEVFSKYIRTIILGLILFIIVAIIDLLAK